MYKYFYAGENEDFLDADSFRSIYDSSKDIDMVVIKAADYYYHESDPVDTEFKLKIWDENGDYKGIFDVEVDFSPTFYVTKREKIIMLWVAIAAYLLTLGWFTGVNLFLTGWKELGLSDLFVWVICSVLLWMSLNFRLWTALRPRRKFRSLYSRAVKCAWFEDQKRK